DFAKARYALTKANVPLTNLVAILDPSTDYTLSTQANFVNALSPYQQAESIVRDGMTTGFRFRYNIFGFDCYVSNYLQSGFTSSIDGSGGSTSNGVANLFFSAAGGDIAPIIGGFRQMPTV